MKERDDRQARRIERERAARKLAEKLFEERSEELYEANCRLYELSESLRQSQNHLKLIATHAPVGIAELDRNLMVIYANHRYCEIYGLVDDEVVGKHFSEVVGGLEIKNQIRFMRDALAGKLAQGEMVLDSRNLGLRHLSIACQPVGDEDVGITGFILALIDITDRKAVEDRLQHLNEGLEMLVEERAAFILKQNEALKSQEHELSMAKSVFDNSAEAVVVTDPYGTIVLSNPAFSDITGYTEREVKGQKISLLQSRLIGKDHYDDLWASLSTSGKWQGEIEHRRKNGEAFPSWVTFSRVMDAAGNALSFVMTFSDISTLKEAQKQVEFLAYHDTLTGLPNRLLGRERLQQAIHYAHQHQERIALYCLDIDNFKLINDRHGHSVGDQLLQGIVSRLGMCLDEGDTLCRLAGDEFLIIRMEARDQAALGEFGNRLLDALAQPIYLQRGNMDASVSIGIAVYPEDGSDAETLLSNADMALYAAKDGGRRHYRFFNTQMNADLVHYMEVRAQLRYALERKEFILEYQPKLDSGSLNITGVEALIRWAHPVRGMTYPDYFISIAEESELIVEIGNWVIQEACYQAADWLSKGFDFGVMAVNISAVQFRRGDLVKAIRHSLMRSELPPQKLEVELTESMLIEDMPSFLNIISELRNLGISIAMDDFGTGYSSLSYLKSFKPDKLKIDKSFVKGMLTDRDSKSLIQNIILIGKNLNLTTIAEGVETIEEFMALRHMGCDEIQGFLYSKPLIPEYLEQIQDSGHRERLLCSVRHRED